MEQKCGARAFTAGQQCRPACAKPSSQYSAALCVRHAPLYSLIHSHTHTLTHSHTYTLARSRTHRRPCAPLTDALTHLLSHMIVLPSSHTCRDTLTPQLTGTPTRKHRFERNHEEIINILLSYGAHHSISMNNKLLGILAIHIIAVLLVYIILPGLVDVDKMCCRSRPSMFT